MLQISIRFVFLAIIASVASGTNDPVVVDTLKGKLEGSLFFSRSGRPYNAYRGIPFGQAERFQVAQPFPAWSDVKKATTFGNACPHFEILSKSIVGDDDCLFLNVYSPEIKESGKKLPVMVFFYPGGFAMGRSDDFDAKYFMDEDVILVTLNYRIGALGFLTTEDEVAPGNVGLKDQTLGLQWVQENIEAFGGDPKKTTIFGNSAGGASVHFHILSPASTGLFHNACSQSGTAIATWAIQQDPLSNAKTFGKHFNCPTDSSKELIDCLKTKSIQEIVASQDIFKQWAMFPFNTFGPVIEHKNAKSPFLTERPSKLLETGNFNRVPWMVGFVEDEGIVMSVPLVLNENYTKDMNEDWKRVAPIAFVYDNIPSQKTKDSISNSILYKYFDNFDIGEESWDSLSNMFSDYYFVYPTDKSARLHAKYAPVYPYEFAFAGGDPTALRAFWGVSTGEYGVGHSDELQYQFNGFWGSPEYDDKTSHEPFKFSKKFVKMWVNFALNSNPESTDPEWKPITDITTNSSIPYYRIAIKNELSDTDFSDRLEFWNNVDIDKIQTELKTKKSTKDEL